MFGPIPAITSENNVEVSFSQFLLTENNPEAKEAFEYPNLLEIGHSLKSNSRLPKKLVLFVSLKAL